MAVDATWIRDSNSHPTELTHTLRGYSGRRWYRVNSDIESEAVAASGLPKLGDPWAVNLDGCVVTEIRTERAGGQDDGTPGNGGWSWVEVKYDPISSTGGGGGDNPQATRHLDTWTEIRNNIQSETIYKPVDDDGRPELSAPTIRNGDGATRLRGVVEYVVHVAYSSTVAQPAYSRYNSLTVPCHTNRNSITLPALYKMGGTRIQIAAGNALYKGYSASVNGQFLEIAHTIEVAPTLSRPPGKPFLEYWEVVEDDGSVSNDTWSQIYPSADWSDLWP